MMRICTPCGGGGRVYHHLVRTHEDARNSIDAPCMFLLVCTPYAKHATGLPHQDTAYACFIGQFTRSPHAVRPLLLLSDVHACVRILAYLGLRLADAVLCVCCMTRHAKAARHTAAYNYRVSGGCGPSCDRVCARHMCVFVYARPCLCGPFCGA